MSDEIEIVQATGDAMEMVKVLHNDNFGHLFRSELYDDSNFGFLGAAYLAKWGDDFIGEISVKWENDNNFLALYIVSLSVDKNYRNAGVGTRLMRYVMTHHPDARCFLLNVDVSNEHALHLYHKCGFEIVARVPHYYGKSDAYYMRAINLEASPDIQNIQLARHLRTWYRNTCDSF